ncbi:hypothetical protein GCM10027203_13420 [Nonomuraea fastidiosa]
MIGNPTPTFSVFSPIGVMSAMPSLTFFAVRATPDPEVGVAFGAAVGLVVTAAGTTTALWAWKAGALCAAQADAAASATRAGSIRVTRFKGVLLD